MYRVHIKFRTGLKIVNFCIINMRIFFYIHNNTFFFVNNNIFIFINTFFLLILFFKREKLAVQYFSNLLKLYFFMQYFFMQYFSNLHKKIKQILGFFNSYSFDYTNALQSSDLTLMEFQNGNFRHIKSLTF